MEGAFTWWREELWGKTGVSTSCFSSRFSGLLPRVLSEDFTICSLALGRGGGAHIMPVTGWAGAAWGWWEVWGELGPWGSAPVASDTFLTASAF